MVTVMAAVMVTAPVAMVPVMVMPPAPVMVAVAPVVMLMGRSAGGSVGGCTIARWVRVGRRCHAGDKPGKQCNQD
jgi:hypothetical protein